MAAPTWTARIVTTTASNAAIVTSVDFQEDVARARQCRGMTSQGIFKGDSSRGIFQGLRLGLSFGEGPVSVRAQRCVYVLRCGGGKSGLIPNSIRIPPNRKAQIALDSARPRRSLIQ